MGMSTLSRHGLVLMMIVGTTAGLVPIQEASAQQRVMVARGIGGGYGGSSMVSKRSIERYGELVGWGAETQETARAVHQGYVAAMEEAQKARRAAFQEMQRTSEDTGDHSVFMERMPKLEAEHAETTKRLEKALFDDMKALLAGAEQEAKWEKVERMRRREVGLREATLSGEGVDLIEVVNAMKLTPEVLGSVTPALDEYEGDMDRALEAKLALKADVDGFKPTADAAERQKAMEKMQKAMADGKEASKRVQEVNQRHARRISDALPDTNRTAFDEELKKRSFPRVYRPSGVSRDLAGAMGLSDLSAEQRDALAEVKAQYERDLAAANDRWASAIRDSEESSQEGAFATGAGIMRISMGDEPEGLKEARKARRELDEKAGEKVKSILTPGQREKLPKAPPEQDAEAVGGFHVMEAATIMVETDDK